METPPPQLSRIHARLTLRDVDLSYAGRYPHLVAASVAAIVCRNRSDTEAEHAHIVVSDAWEVVIPEFLYGS